MKKFINKPILEKLIEILILFRNKKRSILFINDIKNQFYTKYIIIIYYYTLYSKTSDGKKNLYKINF